ncbi:MAG: hypothetical protein ACRCUY_00390 [Thermoguttaceae bacterium]
MNRNCVVSLIHDDTNFESLWEVCHSLHTICAEQNGQFISLNSLDITDRSLCESILDSLNRINPHKSHRIEIPIISEESANEDRPFIRRAICWQQLCDRLVEDEDCARPTLIVFEQADQLNGRQQHDLARLIRFHRIHAIRRTFVITLHRDQTHCLSSELRELIEETLFV